MTTTCINIRPFQWDGDDQSTPETLAPEIGSHHCSFLWIIVKPLLFSGFHVNLCGCSGLISKIHSLIYIIWCVDNSLGNYPLHLVLSLRSFWVYSHRSLPLLKSNPSSKQPRTAGMAPPRKNVPLVTTTAPAYSKGKGKAIEVAEPESHHSNLSDVHNTDAKDF